MFKNKHTKSGNGEQQDDHFNNKCAKMIVFWICTFQKKMWFRTVDKYSIYDAMDTIFRNCTFWRQNSHIWVWSSLKNSYFILLSIKIIMSKAVNRSMNKYLSGINDHFVLENKIAKNNYMHRSNEHQVIIGESKK